MEETAQLRNYVTRLAGYMARQEHEQLLAPLRSDPKRLEPYGFKVYSQNDEDGILEEIFNRLQIAKGTFIEIGVGNGLECNTFYLLHKGWTGCWVESNKTHQEFIKNKFHLKDRLCLAPAFVTVDNINEIIEKSGSKEADFMSIDIDGNDVHIWKAVEYKPKVVCIEYNSKFPGNAWTGTDFMGSSLAGICEIADEKGYTLVGTNITGVNAFFVRNDLVGDLFAMGDLYNPPRYWMTLDLFMNVGHRADFGLYEDMQHEPTDPV
jgi:hypothetical protein